jgi:hypothetical protein
MADKDDRIVTRIGDILPKLVPIEKFKPPTPIQERLLSMLGARPRGRNDPLPSIRFCARPHFPTATPATM